MKKKSAWSIAAAAVLSLSLLAFLWAVRSPGEMGRSERPSAAVPAKKIGDSIPDIRKADINTPVTAKPTRMRPSLSSHGKELLELTKQGDAAAAKELFQDSTQCYRAQQSMQLLQVKLNACEREDRERFKKDCEQSRAKTLDDLSASQQNALICGDIPKADLNEMRYWSTTKAAETGDADAQACFVQSDFNFQGTNKPADLDIEKYQKQSIEYLKAGLDRGDWRFVALMTTSPLVLSHLKGFLGLVTTGDDMTIYRMTRLLRLGATGDYAADLDRQLRVFLDASAADPRAHPPDKLAAEDAWAKQQYEQHFMNSPLLSAPPVVCGN